MNILQYQKFACMYLLYTRDQPTNALAIYQIRYSSVFFSPINNKTVS